jgi:hypothetical protein
VFLEHRNACDLPNTRTSSEAAVFWKKPTCLALVLFGASFGFHTYLNSRPVLDRAEVEKCLPQGLSLTTPLWPYQPHPKITVESSLTELKVFARDGKLYDCSGKEIYFHRVWPDETAPAGWFAQELYEARRQTLEKLRQQYTVIVVHLKHPGT